MYRTLLCAIAAIAMLATVASAQEPDDETPSDGTGTEQPTPAELKDQLESDLKLEIQAVGMYNKAVQVSREEGDNVSRELFERLLKDEEEHVDWLEAQLHQIGEIGYERYLSQQIQESK